MGNAQDALELVYDLRGSAMTEIAEQISTALGDVGAEKATAAIAKQMRKLLAATSSTPTVVRPEINRVLADNGIEGDDVPKSVFLPGRDQVAGRKRGQRRARHRSAASTGGETSGVHGLGLLGTSINGTELVAESTTAVGRGRNAGSRSRSPEPGRIDRERRHRLGHRRRRHDVCRRRSAASAPAKPRRVTIPLGPAPNGDSRRSKSKSQPVPGEQVTENNEATYTVEFE